jgi:hypothetical protein
MTTTGWPYPRFVDKAWLRPPEDNDPVLATAREAVRSLASLDAGADPAHLTQVIAVVCDLAERLDWALLALVGEARAHGVSWDKVAGGMGVSKQAVHKRFAPYVAEALSRADAAVAPQQRQETTVRVGAQD